MTPYYRTQHLRVILCIQVLDNLLSQTDVPDKGTDSQKRNLFAKQENVTFSHTLNNKKKTRVEFIEEVKSVFARICQHGVITISSF